MRSAFFVWFLALAAALSLGCKKPRQFVRTKAQDERVAAAILTSAPAPKFKLDANFGNKIKLLGVDITPEHPEPGTKVAIDFYWQVDEALPPEGDWQIFVHAEAPTSEGKLTRIIADHYAVEDGPWGAGL